MSQDPESLKISFTFTDHLVLLCFYLPSFYTFRELFSKFEKINLKQIYKDFETCTRIKVKVSEAEPLKRRFGRSLLKLYKLGFVEIVPSEGAVVYVLTELGDSYFSANALK